MTMSSSILIAGSGMIARDAGVYFLQRGNGVTWVSRSESCLIDCQAHVNDAVHRFMSQARGTIRSVSASFLLYDELENETFDAIIECTRETLDDKKDVVARLGDRIGPFTLLATTSLTLSPADIHPACAALRIRVPLEITKSAEIVLARQMPPAEKERVVAFCKENGIAMVCK
jgi:3-hydroxyacyl-CoA dehydrogenase